MSPRQLFNSVDPALSYTSMGGEKPRPIESWSLPRAQLRACLRRRLEVLPAVQPFDRCGCAA